MLPAFFLSYLMLIEAALSEKVAFSGQVSKYFSSAAPLEVTSGEVRHMEKIFIDNWYL